MGSHHGFSQPVLLALLWLFVLVHLSWPKRAVTAPAVPTEPEPLQPQRSRSNEPKPGFQALATVNVTCAIICQMLLEPHYLHLNRATQQISLVCPSHSPVFLGSTLRVQHV